eukprot:2192495-Rhodomonas_salina.3
MGDHDGGLFVSGKKQRAEKRMDAAGRKLLQFSGREQPCVWHDMCDQVRHPHGAFSDDDTANALSCTILDHDRAEHVVSCESLFFSGSSGGTCVPAFSGTGCASRGAEFGGGCFSL